MLLTSNYVFVIAAFGLFEVTLSEKDITKTVDKTDKHTGSRTKRALVNPGYGSYDPLLYSSLLQQHHYLQGPSPLNLGPQHPYPTTQLAQPYYAPYIPQLFQNMGLSLLYPGSHPGQAILPMSPMDIMARMGGHKKKKKRKKKQPKVVHLTDCHDDHDACHEHDNQHVISFDKHDHDYHDDDHDYHGDYHDLDHGYTYNDYHDDHADYHDDHGDYHDEHGDYHGDYHDDYHGDYHDYHDHGGYRNKKKVYRPKVVIIKKIIEQSTTTMPLPPPS